MKTIDIIYICSIALTFIGAFVAFGSLLLGIVFDSIPERFVKLCCVIGGLVLFFGLLATTLIHNIIQKLL